MEADFGGRFPYGGVFRGRFQFGGRFWRPILILRKITGADFNMELDVWGNWQCTSYYTATIDKTTKKIEHLKLMQGKGNCWALYLIDWLVLYSYQGKDPDLLTLAMLKGLCPTMKYCSGEKMAPILASVGLLLVMVETFPVQKSMPSWLWSTKTPNANARTRLVVCRHAIHYQIPTKLCKNLLEGYDAGVKSGNLESAF